MVNLTKHWYDFQPGGGESEEATETKANFSVKADEEELVILAKRVPESVKKRFLQRPDAFRAFATCDDATLDKLMIEIGKKPVPRKSKKK